MLMFFIFIENVGTKLEYGKRKRDKHLNKATQFHGTNHAGNTNTTT